MIRLARRAIRSRLSRAIPSYAENRARLKQAKRAHQKTKPLMQAMQADMLKALRGTE